MGVWNGTKSVASLWSSSQLVLAWADFWPNSRASRARHIWAKIDIFRLKCWKLMAAYIGVKLIGPGHCLNIDGCSYWGLQLRYHWWLPTLGLKLMKCYKKVLHLGNVLHFVGQRVYWSENGIDDFCSPQRALRHEHNFFFWTLTPFTQKGNLVH
jgi:hypothetical protein